MLAAGLGAVTMALRQHFGDGAGAAVPCFDADKMRADLFTFNLFCRVSGGALAACILGAGAVCDSLMDLGDMATAASIMALAVETAPRPKTKANAKAARSRSARTVAP